MTDNLDHLFADNLDHLFADDRVEPRRQERIARDWKPNAEYEVLQTRLDAGEPSAVAALTPHTQILLGFYLAGKAAAAAHPIKEN